MLQRVFIVFALCLAATVPAPAAAADRLDVRGARDLLPLTILPHRTVEPPPASDVLISGTLDGRRAFGCAVIVAERRDTITLLTAAHNMKISRSRFTTVLGEALHVRTIVPVDGHDLAVVTADHPRWKFEVARFAPPPAIGTRVRVWGPIEDTPFTPQDATVRAIDDRLANPPEGALAIDCPACDHGDSGSGVFDEHGQLIGIVTASYSSGKQRLFVLVESYRPNIDLVAEQPS